MQYQILSTDEQSRDQGYAPEHIIEALSTFKMDTDKSKKFLTSFGLLIEMGFSPESVKRALIQENFVKEAALDRLLDGTM